MKAVVAGATGFIGRYLVDHWLSQGHQVTVIGRSLAKIKRCFADDVEAVLWKDLTAQTLKGTDVLVNLAGHNIAQGRWSGKVKQQIRDSRLNTTEQLAQLCGQLGEAAPRWLNASAIGVYDLSSACTEMATALRESDVDISKESDDFSTQIARDWEAATLPAQQAGVSVVQMRFAVVLARQGGALKKMLPSFAFGLGGPMGSGQQSFSWVSRVDLIAAIDYLCDHTEITGPVNMVAPEVVSQKQLAKAIGKAIHRPACLAMPQWMMRILFGQMAEELLLKGMAVAPTRLLESGFEFACPDIVSAFRVDWPDARYKYKPSMREKIDESH